MIDPASVYALSDFQQNTEMHLKRLRSTGKPQVLTINGQAELVVQSAAAYQKLLDLAEEVDSVRILRERIAAADAGCPGIPADQVLAAVRQRLGLRTRNENRNGVLAPAHSSGGATVKTVGS